MNSLTLAFLGLLFLLTKNSTISTTQVLLLVTLLSTTNCGCLDNLTN